METALNKWSPAAAQNRQLGYCRRPGWCVAVSTPSVRVCRAYFSDGGNSLNQCLHFSAFMWETHTLCVYVCAQVGCRKKCTVMEPAGF